MLTTVAQPIKTVKPMTNVVRQTPTNNRPRPSFLAVLLRTLSAFAA
jgi:hypothetical protein